MRILVLKKRDLYIGVGLLLIVIIGLLFFWQYSKDRTVSSIQLKYNYQRLLPEEAHVFIQNNPNIVILDVRSKKEYDLGHLSNANFIPLKNLKGNLEELDQQNTYLVYCENGKDSLKASKLMAESGFPRVFTLIGGYKKWPYEIRKIH